MKPKTLTIKRKKVVHPKILEGICRLALCITLLFAGSVSTNGSLSTVFGFLGGMVLLMALSDLCETKTVIVKEVVEVEE